jgi:predicted DNA-binding protein
MKTLTLRVDQELDSWLENEAKRLGKTKSGVVREAIAQHKNGRKPASIHDCMQDVCEIIKNASRDVSSNTRKYLKAFGQ